MNHYVPNLNGERADDAGVSQTLCAENEHHQSKRPGAVESRQVPHHVSEHLDFMDCYFGLPNKELHMVRGLEPQEHTVQREGVTSAGGRESVAAVDMPLCSLPPQEDEMLLWLQYPLMDSIEQNYCSEEIFGGASLNVRAIKDKQKNAFHSSWKETYELSGSGSTYCNTGNRAVIASLALTPDVPITLRARQASGHIAQDGVDVFKRVRGNVQQGGPKQEDFGSKIAAPCVISENCSSPIKLSQIPSYPEGSGSSFRPCLVNDDMELPYHKGTRENRGPAVLPSSYPSSAFCSVATAEANLHLGGNYAYMDSVRKEGLTVHSTINMDEVNMQLCGIDNGPVCTDRGKKGLCVTGESWSTIPKTSYDSETVVVDLCAKKECDPSFQTGAGQGRSNSGPNRDCIVSSYHRKDGNIGKGKVDPGNLDPSSSLNASDTFCSADVTITSSSDENSDKSDKDTTTSSSKKRISVSEQSVCRIKDLEGATVTAKKPGKGASSRGKRTRAAEIHNLSEKKRRNKINLKMKALQELIPNANKTDKASMLDEAIEYMKTLQAQLQFMSMRTGIAVSPMILPAGMQLPHLQQNLAYSQMHVGMGVSMSMGMGMCASVAAGTAGSFGAGISTSFGAGQSIVAMPPVTGQPVPVYAYHVGGVRPGGFALYGSTSVTPSACVVDQQQQAFGQTSQSNMQMNPEVLKAFLQQQQPPPQHGEHL